MVNSPPLSYWLFSVLVRGGWVGTGAWHGCPVLRQAFLSGSLPAYHWNTAKFKTLWRTKFAVLMARERGRIGSDAALGDMPKRLQAHSYDEMNEGPAR